MTTERRQWKRKKEESLVPLYFYLYLLLLLVEVKYVRKTVLSETDDISRIL